WLLVASSSARRFDGAIVRGLGAQVATAYGVLVAPTLGAEWSREQYLIVTAIHIPLLCWGALGFMALRGRLSSAADRFAFLITSIEVAIVAGLYLLAGMAFVGITIGMFASLSVELPYVPLP